MDRASLSDETEDRSVLFEYWRDLPLVQIHDLPSEIIESHRVRPAIMKILRAGIPDEKESGRLRHALNTKEIRRTLLDREGIKMSQHNLYFHLNKLEEIGYIKVVARLLEGRHNVAYYGRTARSILRRDTEESLEKYERWFQEMGKVAKVKRPEFDMARLEGLAEEYLEIMRRRDRAQGEWMASNERLIYEGEIDSYSIFGLIQTMDVMDSEYIGFIKKVRELFEISL
jgi:DNA-binding MarR family transcriptional regulator